MKPVHREIMELVYKKYAGEAFGKARPAFDGSRNLYMMKDLPVGRDGVCILPPMNPNSSPNYGTQMPVHMSDYFK